MKTKRIVRRAALLCPLLCSLLCGGAAAQPVHRFSVKIGIDRTSVDSLGGLDRVRRLTEDMFRRIDRAFNYDGRFRARYEFVVDWDAFYVYDGLSTDEIGKPHPEHDYLVVMDGYKSDLRAAAGTATNGRRSTMRGPTTTASTRPSSGTPSTASSTSSAMPAACPTSTP